ncbi:membrane protein insertion efficiency factor YidD [Candidatus Dojkabacteria bacterium]|uniref:Putative membrane protein insertion efficiency factor n=1 Tax=Candidatus Dojkabacteria bacterium TaxID=2099670 RepID=A0A955L3K8_9BACT|nr:membrane protein insertion efficiency factor YidD [Candidatus Dojkabacteria bacterium]
MNILKEIILFSIRIYQKTLSLDHGILGKILPYRACIYTPTCSEYGYEAIEKYGLRKGIYLGTKRVLRCSPAGKGGYDPVP